MNLKRQYNFSHRVLTGPCNNKTSYGLAREDWNDTLRAEFEDYRRWRTTAYNFDRPQKMLQRDLTFNNSIYEFEGYFGYLVAHQCISAVDLRLSQVGNAALVRAYVDWHAAERTHNKPSRYMQKSVGVFYSVARYYLNAPTDQWLALGALRQACKPRQRRDNRAVRNTLDAIDEVGLAEKPAVTDLDNALQRFAQIRLALRAQRSLILRLLVRRPLRSRNIREMRLERNLLKENGEWWIEFQGEELKVGEVRGRINIYRQPFPIELVSQLDEFLTVWRPLLPGAARREIFTTKGGLVFAEDTLNTEVKRTLYAYTEHATNIHEVRHIWATEYILATQDFITAAEMLGDRVETVLQHYADLRRADAGRVADRVIEQIVAGQLPKRIDGAGSGGGPSAAPVSRPPSEPGSVAA